MPTDAQARSLLTPEAERWLASFPDQLPEGGNGRKNPLRAALRRLIEVSPLRSRLFWRIPVRTPSVALTFDDGPHPDHTPRVLDILALYGVRATFFVTQVQAKANPQLLLRIQRDGHALGNHSATHARFDLLSEKELQCEIAETDSLLGGVRTSKEPPVLRPPFGAVLPAQAWKLTRAGRRIAFWSRDARDYRGAPPREIAALGHTLLPRDIVLMHDRFPATVEALPELLERLQDRGISTVTLDDPAELS